MKTSTLIGTRTATALANHLRSGLLALGLGAALATTVAAKDANPAATIFPPASEPYDMTYGEWAAAWQQWAFGVPAPGNPLLDEKGDAAANGQSGPVWFLAGNFGGTTTREITVPRNVGLFFPVVNSFFVRTEETEPTDIDGIRDIIVPPLADAQFACEIDGQPVANLASYYTETPLFDQTFPADNIFGLAPDTYGPAMNAGYYLMLKPLRVGEHVIHFTGAVPFYNFSLDVTYKITVK